MKFVTGLIMLWRDNEPGVRPVLIMLTAIALVFWFNVAAILYYFAQTRGGM